MSILKELGKRAVRGAWNKTLGSKDAPKPINPETLNLIMQATGASGTGQVDLAKALVLLESRFGTNASSNLRLLLIQRQDLIAAANNMESMQITAQDIDKLIITECTRAGVIPEALQQQQMMLAAAQRAIQPLPWYQRISHGLFGGLDPYDIIDQW